MASTHGSNIIESCRLAPLTKTTNGMPWASTMMCRLEPNLPLSVGFGPVSWPPGGLAPKSHQCWPGSNQFGHVREGEQASLGAVAPRHLQHSSHANAANTSYRCHSPKLEQVFPCNASLENKQDAIEGRLITDGALAAATFARCNEGRNESHRVWWRLVC